MKREWQSRWQHLAPRERNFILYGSGGVLLALLWAYAWLPLQQQGLRLSQNLPRLRQQAQQMQAARDEVPALRARAVPLGTLPLLQVLPPALSAAGLPAAQFEPGGNDNTLSLSLQNAAFDAWLGCLSRLQATQGVRLVRLEVRATGTPGQVNLQATVSRE